MKPSSTVLHMTQELSLPSQVLGASQIEITGSHQILLSGHTGIRSYSETEIIVDLRDCAVILTGSGLGMRSMTKTELLLTGTLDSLRFLR